MISSLLVLIRILVGGVFVYSGWNKLMAPVENFIAVLQGYQFLPSNLIPIVAFFVPWVEFLIGSFLMLGFATRLSAKILGVFLIVFITLLARSLWLHLPIHECGCFGAGINLSPKQAIALDSGLLLGVFVLIGRKTHIGFGFDQWLNKSKSHIKRV